MQYLHYRTTDYGPSSHCPMVRAQQVRWAEEDEAARERTADQERQRKHAAHVAASKREIGVDDIWKEVQSWIQRQWVEGDVTVTAILGPGTLRGSDARFYLEWQCRFIETPCDAYFVHAKEAKVHADELGPSILAGALRKEIHRKWDITDVGQHYTHATLIGTWAVIGRGPWRGIRGQEFCRWQLKRIGDGDIIEKGEDVITWDTVAQCYRKEWTRIL